MVEGWVVTIIVSASLVIIGWLVQRITAQNEVHRTQRETIDTQKRQIDRLETAADVTNDVLARLPLPRAPGGGKR